MADTKVDVAVIGTGTHGLATARHLAARGLSVMGIDKDSPPDGRFGSYKGDTRNGRFAAGEGELYTQWSLESCRLWREAADEVQARTGIRPQVMRETGVIIIQNDEKAPMHGAPDFRATQLSGARNFGVTHSTDKPALMRRFDQFRYTENGHIYYEENAPTYFTRQCLETLLTLAKLDGAQFRFNAGIAEIERHGGGEGGGRITMANGETVDAGAVVITAGAWAQQFLAPELRPKFAPYLQTMYWFAMEEPELYTDLGKRFPPFVYTAAQGTLIYGFPDFHDAGKLGIRPGVKIARENLTHPWQGPIEAIASLPPDEREIKVLGESAKIYLGGGVRGAVCLASQHCMYMLGPDYHPTVWFENGNLLGIACGGHSFKWGLRFGQELAEAVIAGRLSPVLQTFRPGRFPSPG